MTSIPTNKFTISIFLLCTLILSICLVHLSGCSATNESRLQSSNSTGDSSMLSTNKDGAPSTATLTSRMLASALTPSVKPKIEPLSPYGNHSYKMRGHYYRVLKDAKGYRKVGTASWYGTRFDGKLTSTRETYNLYGMTAASPTLPLPTYVVVTNLANHKQVVLKVNDRGPFRDNRIIDVSYAAAKKLGFDYHGTAKVEVKAIDPNTWPDTAPEYGSESLFANNNNSAAAAVYR